MRSALVVLVLAVAACGGDDGAGAIDAAVVDAPDIDTPVAIDAPPDAASANTGFPTPTQPTRANQFSGGTWTELGPADWSCLGTASTDQPATTSIALSGRVSDFQIGDGVGAATVTAFATTAPGTALGSTTSSAQAATRGDYAMTVAPLPVGVRRYGFRVDATGYLRTYEFARYLTPGATQTAELTGFAVSTANALPAFVGVTRDPSTGLVIGAMTDCGGRAVSNAVATISSAAGSVAELPGITTYYFSAGSQALPVRHSQAAVMNKDGRFLVLDAPPATTAYVQVWGFRNATELAAGAMMLLAQAPILIEADAVSTVQLAPRRAP